MKRFSSFLIALLIICLIGGFSYAADKGNTRFQSFSKVKMILLKQVYSDHLTTFYCNCPFTMKKKIIPSDRYTPKKKWERAKSVEWEHIVPAYQFGHNFPEWKNESPDCLTSKGKPYKGRKCVEKIQPQYRYMQADMYNLVPAVGEINGLRSNYPYGIIPGEKREFGNCDMEIEDRKAEPPPEKRGDIARTYFYMDWAYPGYGIISKKNRKLFDAWDKEDPVDT
ncbi:MAG: endonuclease [Syntrophales bacterium]|nr:endonuclease [Syntrophales bacterium]